MADITRDIFLAFMRIHILHHAAESPVCGVWMMDELRHHGYAISPGTLYPLLHRLTASGYLTCDRRVENGRVRKYYAITQQGREALASIRPRIRELVGEALA